MSREFNVNLSFYNIRENSVNLTKNGNTNRYYPVKLIFFVKKGKSCKLNREKVFTKQGKPCNVSNKKM